MGYHHSTATVASKAQLVEHSRGLVSCSNSLAECLPLVANLFAAGEASDGNNHVWFILPVGFLLSSSWTRSAELFRLGHSLVPSEHYSIKCLEVLSQLTALRPRRQGSCNGYSSCFRLPHYSPTVDADSNVQVLPFLSRNDHRFKNFQPGYLGGNAVKWIIVNPYSALSLLCYSSRYGSLALTGFQYQFFLFAYAPIPPISSATCATLTYGTRRREALASSILTIGFP